MRSAGDGHDWLIFTVAELNRRGIEKSLRISKRRGCKGNTVCVQEITTEPWALRFLEVNIRSTMYLSLLVNEQSFLKRACSSVSSGL